MVALFSLGFDKSVLIWLLSYFLILPGTKVSKSFTREVMFKLRLEEWVQAHQIAKKGKSIWVRSRDIRPTLQSSPCSQTLFIPMSESLWARGQQTTAQGSICLFLKYGFVAHHLLLSVAAFALEHGVETWVVVTETVWPESQKRLPSGRF